MESHHITYRIIGCAMRVHNELGPGLREKPYENALAIDFKEQEIVFDQQPRYPILYHRKPVGDCQPDFLVCDQVIVDCKSIPKIADDEIGQVINYLRIARKNVGLILNFRNGKLEFKRVML